MPPRLATWLMIGLLILGIAGPSWAQITRSHSNPWSFTANQPGEQNFQTPGNNPWSSMTPSPGGQIDRKYNNPWASDNSGPGLGIQVSPTFKTPWGSSAFGPGGPVSR